MKKKLKKKAKRKEENNPNFLISMGFVFLGAGVVFLTTLDEVVGILAIIVGIIYIGLWAKNRK